MPQEGRASIALADSYPDTRNTPPHDPPHRHRPGHHLDARDRVRCGARAGREPRSRSSRQIYPAPGGSSTIRRRSGPRGRDRARGDGEGRRRAPRTSPASASPTSARPRSSGIAPPASRSTTPSSGRTGAPPRPARGCARRRPRGRRSRPRPGCCSIRISPPPRSPGCSTTWRARAPRPSRGGSHSARSTRSCSGGSPAARSTPPTRPTRRARMLFDIRRGAWDEDLCECSRVPAGVLPQVRDCAADFGATCPICSAARSASSASPATSRPRPSGRAASRPA